MDRDGLAGRRAAASSSSDGAITAIEFSPFRDADGRPQRRPRRRRPGAGRGGRQLTAYFARDLKEFDLPLAPERHRLPAAGLGAAARHRLRRDRVVRRDRHAARHDQRRLPRRRPGQRPQPDPDRDPVPPGHRRRRHPHRLRRRSSASRSCSTSSRTRSSDARPSRGTHPIRTSGRARISRRVSRFAAQPAAATRRAARRRRARRGRASGRAGGRAARAGRRPRRRR